MIDRLIYVPLEKSTFKGELNTIKHIVTENSEVINIDKIICRKLLHATFPLISALSLPDPYSVRKLGLDLPS